MTQSILQNGYAILAVNTSELDQHLLEWEALLNRMTLVLEQKKEAQKNAIEAREKHIATLDDYLLILPGTDANAAAIAQARDMRMQLERQVEQIAQQNVHATFDDVRKTHAFFINNSFRPLVPVSYGYSTTGAVPVPLFGSSAQFRIPIYGDFLSDQVLHIRLSALEAAHKENRVRWFDFIGHRMIKEVRLVSNGVILDRYGCEEMEMYYRFHVTENHKLGWMRCVGQETPLNAIFVQDPLKQAAREVKSILDGLQTPKQRHEAADLYIPLLFWYNTDPAFALSNWNITFDKMFIEVDFIPVKDCVAIIDFADDGGKYAEPRIEKCELITNHIYTMPDVANLFKHKTQFNLIRVHKRVERILDKPQDLINIGEIKHAVETLYVRFRPEANELNENRAEVWRMNDLSTYKEVKYPSIISTGGTTSLAYTPAYFYEQTPVVDTIALSSNGSVVYDTAPSVFFNSYLPLRFAGKTPLVTPGDKGAYLFTFGIFPGNPQPSGYLNFSGTREHYISYNSSYITTDTSVTIVVCASCINFLVLTDGTMSLKYVN